MSKYETNTKYEITISKLGEDLSRLHLNWRLPAPWFGTFEFGTFEFVSYLAAAAAVEAVYIRISKFRCS